MDQEIINPPKGYTKKYNCMTGKVEWVEVKKKPEFNKDWKDDHIKWLENNNLLLDMQKKKLEHALHLAEWNMKIMMTVIISLETKLSCKMNTSE